MDKCPECGHPKDKHTRAEHGCIICKEDAYWDWDLPICDRIYTLGDTQ